jgi:hypothetical protein
VAIVANVERHRDSASDGPAFSAPLSRALCQRVPPLDGLQMSIRDCVVIAGRETEGKFVEV